MKRSTFISRRRRARECLENLIGWKFRFGLKPFGRYMAKECKEMVDFWYAEYLAWRDAMYNKN